MRFIISILLFLNASIAFAGDKRCYDPNWRTVSYSNNERGEVSIYITPPGYQVTPTNIACLVGIQFLGRVNDVPNRFVTGFISEDLSSGYIVQWSLDENYLILIEGTIPAGSDSVKGIYTKYPKPLQRIKELIINRPFPKPVDLPFSEQDKIIRNYVRLTPYLFRKLLNQ